jgi:hypothetical protein
VEEPLKVRSNYHIFATNLLSCSHIFVMFVSQKFEANQIVLPQTHPSSFVIDFVSKFVAKM